MIHVFIFNNPRKESKYAVDSYQSQTFQKTKLTVLPNFQSIPFFLDFFDEWNKTSIKLEALEFYNEMIIALIKQAFFEAVSDYVCVWFNDVWVGSDALRLAHESLECGEVMVGIQHYQFRFGEKCFGGWFCFNRKKINPPSYFLSQQYSQGYVLWTNQICKSFPIKILNVEWRHDA